MVSGKAGQRIVIWDDQSGYETPPVSYDDQILEIRNELQPIFNPLRSHIFSAGRDDDVFFSIGNLQETVRIEGSDVSRMKPTSAKRFGCFTVHTVVALHYV